MSRELHCNVLVVAGIHYDNITKEEITEVLKISRKAAEQFISMKKREN
ncbi:MAG: hypothetical protein ACTSRU_09545 [Candidatus Hodarchaeales archaeon]